MTGPEPRRCEDCGKLAGCRCGETPRPFAGDVLDFARDALARARQVSAANTARMDQLAAGLRVRVSQLTCLRCFGNPADPRWPGTLGTGDCTCEGRCARPYCDPPPDGGWSPWPAG